MISLQGVPSVLIAKNQSWVRKQAQALVRHLPANVERADLIQVGLIAVAQAAVSFEWTGDRDTAEAQEAFVRYARMRVKGAMLDELRQMDYLTRGERRKIKVVQIARERLRSRDGKEPGLSLLAETTGIDAQEISSLMQADQFGRHQGLGEAEDDEHGMQRFHPATPQEEVEARVDTGIVLRRLERFFAELPERERMVIDAYLGVGLTPVEVARSLQVTPSRVSQMYQSLVKRVAVHFGHAPEGRQRATDRHVGAVAAAVPVPCPVDTRSDAFAELMRERELKTRGEARASWGELMEQVLAVERSESAEPALAVVRRASASAARPAGRGGKATKPVASAAAISPAPQAAGLPCPAPAEAEPGLRQGAGDKAAAPVASAPAVRAAAAKAPAASARKRVPLPPPAEHDHDAAKIES